LTILGFVKVAKDIGDFKVSRNKKDPKACYSRVLLVFGHEGVNSFLFVNMMMTNQIFEGSESLCVIVIELCLMGNIGRVSFKMKSLFEMLKKWEISKRFWDFIYFSFVYLGDSHSGELDKDGPFGKFGEVVREILKEVFFVISFEVKVFELGRMFENLAPIMMIGCWHL